ncbi:MAG: hypothetical protein ACI808_001771, partial [Paraglaciecola sp.]
VELDSLITQYNLTLNVDDYDKCILKKF